MKWASKSVVFTGLWVGVPKTIYIQFVSCENALYYLTKYRNSSEVTKYCLSVIKVDTSPKNEGTVIDHVLTWWKLWSFRFDIWNVRHCVSFVVISVCWQLSAIVKARIFLHAAFCGTSNILMLKVSINKIEVFSSDQSEKVILLGSNREKFI